MAAKVTFRKFKSRINKKLDNVEKFAEDHPFQAESLRTIIFGFVGALLAATIINLLSDWIGFKSEVYKARLSAKVDAVREYGEKSYQFTLSAQRYKEYRLSYDSFRDDYDKFRIVSNQIFVLTGSQSVKDTTDEISSLMLSLISDNLRPTQEAMQSKKQPIVKFDTIRASIKDKSNRLQKYVLEELLEERN